MLEGLQGHEGRRRGATFEGSFKGLNGFKGFEGQAEGASRALRGS